MPSVVASSSLITASEPSWMAPFTGLSPRQFGKLVAAVRSKGANPALQPVSGSARRPCSSSTTPVPTRDHTVAEQSKNYRYSTNHQVVIDADIRFLYARQWTSEAERARAIAVRNNHYNCHRPHTATGNRPPASRLTPPRERPRCPGQQQLGRVSKVDLGRGPDAEAAKRPGHSRRRTAAGPGREQFPMEPSP